MSPRWKFFIILLGASLSLILLKKGYAVYTALNDYKDDIANASTDYGIPVSWIQAVIMTESSGNPNAYRAEPQINDASYGLMQLLYSTAKGLGYAGAAEGLYDPKTNVRLGTYYLKQIASRPNVGMDIERVYSAYNSGKPDNYLTNPTVKANVARLMSFLQGVA